MEKLLQQLEQHYRERDEEFRAGRTGVGGVEVYSHCVKCLAVHVRVYIFVQLIHVHNSMLLLSSLLRLSLFFTISLSFPYASVLYTFSMYMSFTHIMCTLYIHTCI